MTVRGFFLLVGYVMGGGGVGSLAKCPLRGWVFVCSQGTLTGRSPYDAPPVAFAIAIHIIVVFAIALDPFGP